MSNEKERMFKVLKDAGLMEHYHETVESIREDAMIKGAKMDLCDVFDLVFRKALREKNAKDQNKLEAYKKLNCGQKESEKSPRITQETFTHLKNSLVT